MSPAHCDKNPSDFQGRGTAFIATKPRPTSRVALRQKTVRLPGIRQLDIATSRPTSRDSTWEHRKNGHFLNCGEQTNDVRVVASHGVQGLEQWEDGGLVTMASRHRGEGSRGTTAPPPSTNQDVVVEHVLLSHHSVAAEPVPPIDHKIIIISHEMPAYPRRRYHCGPRERTDPGHERSHCYGPHTGSASYSANPAVIPFGARELGKLPIAGFRLRVSPVQLHPVRRTDVHPEVPMVIGQPTSSSPGGLASTDK
jgi:hypothetical protein